MKIISICGPDKSGKTTTLNILIKKILNCLNSVQKVIAKSPQINGKDIDDFIESIELEINHFVVIEINGRKIGISTYGDAVLFLERHFKYFDDCDLVFCAVHPNSNMLTYIEEKSKNDTLIIYNHLRVSGKNDNHFENHCNLANNYMAELLFKTFENFLNNNL